MLKSISNLIYRRVMRRAIELAGNLAKNDFNNSPAARQYILAAKKFVTAVQRLKPLVGSRPIMSEVETLLVILSDNLLKAGIGNFSFSDPDQISSAILTSHTELKNAQDKLSTAYKIVGGKELFSESPAKDYSLEKLRVRHFD